MSVDGTTKQGERIAIVGGGVAGLSAAWHLLTVNSNTSYDVHVFEKESTLGGHAHTVTITNDDGENNNEIDVDIGFMVFNETNYPNMIQWFQSLGVEMESSDMSLAVSLDHGTTVEWNSDGLNGLFAKRSQLFSPSFYQFLKGMIQFNTNASQLLKLHPDDPRRQVTTKQYLKQNGYLLSDKNTFATYYLLPMMAALWSASMEEVMEFPAEQLIGFLCNHKMLQLFDRPEWKTVKGRSKMYTSKMQQLLNSGDETRAHVSTPIVAVEVLSSNKYELFTTHHESLGLFDHVIFACHPPTAASILEQGVRRQQQQQKNKQTSDTTDNNDATATASPIIDKELLQKLKQVQYADNVLYVHSDPKLMPLRRHAWSSWNCLGKLDEIQNCIWGSDEATTTTTKSTGAMEGSESGFGSKLVVEVEDGDAKEGGNDLTVAAAVPQQRMKAVYVTYWLNRLQNLNSTKNYFVSLNPHVEPSEELTHKRLVLGHPQFTPQTLEARQWISSNQQDRQGLWFCGAWMGYGFHEDGCRSGFDVATQLSGIPLPWASTNTEEGNSTTKQLMVLPPPDLSQSPSSLGGDSSIMMFPFRLWNYVYQQITHDLPVALCKRFVLKFMSKSIQYGSLQLLHADGTLDTQFGDSNKHVGCDVSPVSLRIYDPWFYVKIAMEYDLGLARSYMAGHFVVEPLENTTQYNPILRPASAKDETTKVLGDPIGLTRLFFLLIGNRDAVANSDQTHIPQCSARNHQLSNSLANASGFLLSQIGSFINYMKYKLYMNNSERGGSLKNIHAHYNLSNDLFRTFLDKETLMYSSAIYDAVPHPCQDLGLQFRGTLEEAQWRKLDTLLERAQIQPGQTMLDIGFGWGGLSIHAAKKYKCQVTGITLSVEQKALAEERVQKEGLQELISFEVIDYRTFARLSRNRGKFDRVLSCEMIEAVGHDHLGDFFWAVEQVLAPNGILVMEAITTPEARYETYKRSTDFINTIVFPGSCCPSLHALVDAAYQQSSLTLEHIDNIGLHYAQTLAEWRRRFNSSTDVITKQLGFDDVFLRVWNYYLTYCEAGFYSQTEHCLILVWSRPGCRALVPLCETRSVTQAPPFTTNELEQFTTASSSD